MTEQKKHDICSAMESATKHNSALIQELEGTEKRGFIEYLLAFGVGHLAQSFTQEGIKDPDQAVKDHLNDMIDEMISESGLAP